MKINPGFTVRELVPRKENMDWKKYRLAWDEYPKRDIVDDAPIHLDLETTNLCQLKCPGCPSQRLDYEKGVMDKEMALEAITEFGELGGKSIKFNWRGEPTLCPFLFSLIRAARRHGILDTMLNTNGVLVSSFYSYFLLKSGITTVVWSIDSSDRATYERLRPGADFVEVTKNLRGFLLMREKLGLTDECYVRVQRIRYPNTKESDEEFNEYFQKNFPGLNAVATNHYKEKSMEGRTDRPSRPCAQLWQRLVMDFQGNIGPCCEMNRFKTSLGNYEKTTLKRAWKSDGLQFLRKCHNDGDQNTVEACRKCTVTKA